MVPMGSKREDATTEDRSAGNTLMEEKSVWKTTNYIDTISNLVKDLSSKLLEHARAFWECIAMCLCCSSVISTCYLLLLKA